MPAIEFRMLGPLEVLEHGRPLALGGAQSRALLAVLLLHRGQVVSRDRLIDELWGEAPPATAGKIVRGSGGFCQEFTEARRGKLTALDDRSVRTGKVGR